MHNANMSELLTEALVAMGCDSSMIEKLDAQADIVLDFHDLPSIHLSHDTEDVCLWAVLGERHDHQRLIEMHASSLMQVLTQPQFYARGGALGMAVKDDALQLFVLVHPDYLADSERLGAALNAFFEQLMAVNQIATN